MDVFLTILFMMTIGAIIGGVTNHIAIQMIFRPYYPIYFAGKKLPFTPGLIPKRREELAVQLGNTVVKHLLTAEGIRSKLIEPALKTEMEAWARAEVNRLFESEQTVTQLLEKFDIADVEEKIDWKLNSYIELRYEALLGQARTKTLGEIIPEEWLRKVDAKVPEFSSYILEKGIDYFDSEEGKDRLSIMITDFLENMGSLGNMVKMFISNDAIVNSIQPELLKFLNHEGTHHLLTQLLFKEWTKVKMRKIDSIEENLGKEQILSFLKTQIKEQIPYKKWLQTQIGDLASPYKEKVMNSIVPRTIDMTILFISNRVEEMMERLRLAEIVQAQVTGFSVVRLEEMVLGIIKKEFKMITFLGALLGGIIGIVQGLIVYFFQ